MLKSLPITALRKWNCQHLKELDLLFWQEIEAMILDSQDSQCLLEHFHSSYLFHAYSFPEIKSRSLHFVSLLYSLHTAWKNSSQHMRGEYIFAVATNSCT